MKKVNIFALIAIMWFVLFLAVVFVVPAVGSSSQISWTVPAGVTKIRVTSTLDGDQVLSRKISVEPGQKFTVEVVE